MMLSGLALAAALLAQTATASAEAATPDAEAAQPQAPTPAAKPAEPKKVCVTQAQIGSHFKKRICATPQEWEERRLRDAEALAKAQGGAQCRGSGC